MAVVWRALTSCCCGGDEADDREALLAKDEEEDRPPPLTLPLLKESDDATTSAIIHEFKEDAVFRQFATAEMEGIIRRDQEDDDKLAAGILMAVQRAWSSRSRPWSPSTVSTSWARPPTRSPARSCKGWATLRAEDVCQLVESAIYA